MQTVWVHECLDLPGSHLGPLNISNSLLSKSHKMIQLRDQQNIDQHIGTQKLQLGKTLQD